MAGVKICLALTQKPNLFTFLVVACNVYNRSIYTFFTFSVIYRIFWYDQKSKYYTDEPIHVTSRQTILRHTILQQFNNYWQHLTGFVKAKVRFLWIYTRLHTWNEFYANVQSHSDKQLANCFHISVYSSYLFSHSSCKTCHVCLRYVLFFGQPSSNRFYEFNM